MKILPQSLADLWNPRIREIVHGGPGAGLATLAEYMQENPPENTEVRRAWSGGPQDEILTALLEGPAPDDVKHAAIEILVANAILRKDPGEEPDIQPQFPQACEIHAGNSRDHLRIISEIDDKDQKLKTEGKILFILHHPAPAKTARHTLGYWLSYWRRWEQIRCRILMRSEDLDFALKGQGADAAKFMMSAIELYWTPMELARLLASEIGAHQSPCKTSTRYYATFSQTMLDDRKKRYRLEDWLHRRLRPVPGEFLAVARRAKALQGKRGRINGENWKKALKAHKKENR